MFSNSAEKTLTLTMGDLSLQTSRTLFPPSSPPIAPPSSASHFSAVVDKPSLSPPAPNNELVDFSDSGFDFYPSSFDNSFPCPGILTNEHVFSSDSPTSNTSFLSETSFNDQSLLNNAQDGRIFRDNSGLLITNTSAYCGNDASRLDFQNNLNFGGLPTSSPANDSMGERNILLSPINFPSSNSQLNDTGVSLSSYGTRSIQWESSPKTSTSSSNNQFEFSFSVSDSSSFNSRGDEGSSNGSINSNASANSSPTRPCGNLLMPNYGNQWNVSDVSTFLDNSSPESTSSTSITTTSLGNSIWSPAQVTSTTTVPSISVKTVSTGSNIDDAVCLDGYPKEKLMDFVNLLMVKQEECSRIGDMVNGERLQSAIVQVQNYIIKNFVSDRHEQQYCENMAPNIMNGVTSPVHPTPNPSDMVLDRIAEMHREIAANKEANYTWSGHLPPRVYRSPVTYSCKVFLGGLPFDISEGTLMDAFKRYGIMKIEWPGKDGHAQKIKGYAYAVFESEKQVKLLLQSCTHDYRNSQSGNYYYKLSSKRFRCKDVQIIPWSLSDSNYVRVQSPNRESLRTIFVGALHGQINAEGLATIMDDLFGGVVFAGVDTDKNKYPIGSARVTFNNVKSYIRAVTAAFVTIKTARFGKKIQIDPYLEDATCSVCTLHKGPYFCREISCFSYYCRTCFHLKHSEGAYLTHIPMMRTANTKLAGSNFNSHMSNSKNCHMNSSPSGNGIRNTYYPNTNNGNNFGSSNNPFGNSNGGGSIYYRNHEKTNNSLNAQNNRNGSYWNNARTQQWSNADGSMSPPLRNPTMHLGQNTSPNGLNAGSGSSGNFGGTKMNPNNPNGNHFSFWNSNANGSGSDYVASSFGQQTFTNRNYTQPGLRQQSTVRW